MKIAVMGAGALGSVFGGMLAQAGEDVVLIGRKPHMEAVSQRGLRITGIFGEHHVKVRAVTSPPEEEQDLVILTVKSYDTATATRDALPLVGRETIFIPIQNGLGNIETVVEVIGRERVLGGMAIFGAVMREPGWVEVTVMASETLVGEIDGGISKRAERIADLFSRAGIPTKASPHIMRDVWMKAFYNIALNPLSAVLGVPYGYLSDNKDARSLVEKLVFEAVEVARKKGEVEIRAEEYLETLWRDKLPPTREHTSSMLQDIQRGRRTEIGHLNGAIVRMGREAGIPTPYNEAVTRIVRALENR